MKGAHYGICVPSSCSISDLDSIFHDLSYENQAAFSQIYYITHNCYSEDRDSVNMPEFTWGDAAYVSVLCLFAILIFWGTIVDLINWNNIKDFGQMDKPYWQTFLLGFSFYANSKKMLDCSKGNSGQINCLNGIRFISMSWVFISHAYTYMFMMAVPPVINGDEMSTNVSLL